MLRQLVVGFLVMAMFAALASCGSSRPKKQEEFRFSTIALVSPKDVLDASQPKSRGEKAVAGAEMGAATGGAGAVAVGALACGPYLYALCVIGSMYAGILAGGATGALYGFSGLPKDATISLEHNVEALSRQHDLASALVDHIRQQVPPEMLAEPEAADIQAILTIENVEFIKEKGKVHLVSTVLATFESTESRRVPQYGSRVFKGQSGDFELKNWLDTSTGDLQEAIRQSLLKVGDKIVTVLNDRWEPALVSGELNR